MTTVAELLLVGATLVAIPFLAYRLLKYPPLKEMATKKSPSLPDRITVHGLGRLEGGFRDLVRVIVICDQVERPEEELGRAVEANFERRVKYLFLISQSRAEAERQQYYRIFETLAQIVIYRTRSRIRLADLVEIQQLPYDWNDYPYVFYQIRDESKGSHIKTVAYRGDQRLEGIANNYSRVDPVYAHTIARSVLSEAPGPVVETIQIDPEQFITEQPAVIPFPKRS